MKRPKNKQDLQALLLNRFSGNCKGTKIFTFLYFSLIFSADEAMVWGTRPKQWLCSQVNFSLQQSTSNNWSPAAHNAGQLDVAHYVLHSLQVALCLCGCKAWHWKNTQCHLQATCLNITATILWFHDFFPNFHEAIYETQSESTRFHLKNSEKTFFSINRPRKVWYLVDLVPQTWTEILKMCVEKGGTLPVFFSKSEQDDFLTLWKFHPGNLDLLSSVFIGLEIKDQKVRQIK